MLSVAMIVKNEGKNIQRALNSVREIADEIVILDTGSTDNTKDIIRLMNESKIKLYDHEWKDDFSEARNRSIELCTQEWIFVFDGDEELSETAQKGLRPLLEKLTVEENTVYMVTKNILSPTMSDMISMPRIFRRGTITYKNAVHNQACSKGVDVRTNLVSIHYGYQWTNELRDKKKTRMLPMLEKTLAGVLSAKEHLYYEVQYYKALLVSEEKAKAYQYGRTILSEASKAEFIPYIMYDFFILFGLQSLEYQNANECNYSINAAKKISGECPDSYMLEMFCCNALRQPLRVLDAYRTYENKCETLDMSEYLFTVQFEKYAEATKLLAVKAMIETGLISEGKALFDTVQPAETFEWALNEVVQTIATKLDAKVAADFGCKSAELADKTTINLSPLASRLFAVGIDTCSTRKKIAIVAAPHLTNFLDGIRNYLAKEYLVQTIAINKFEAAKKYIDWADLTWYEFGNELAISGMRYSTKPAIVRIHGYEVITGLAQKINYANVTRTIFVADHVEKTMGFAKEITKSVIVHNGVNVKKYTYKPHENGFKLAFAGHVNYKKSPELMLQIMAKLVAYDSRYELTWIGENQDLRYGAYLKHMIAAMGLERNVHFLPHQDTNAFLDDKNIFLSTSIHEGYGMAIMEALSKGIKPVIHNFYDSTEFYPSGWLYNTIEEAVRMIINGTYQTEEYRKFAEEHAEEQQLEQIGQIIKEVLV